MCPKIQVDRIPVKTSFSFLYMINYDSFPFNPWNILSIVIDTYM